MHTHSEFQVQAHLEHQRKLELSKNMAGGAFVEINLEALTDGTIGSITLSEGVGSVGQIHLSLLFVECRDPIDN